MTRAAQSIGIAAVLVQAKDEGARAWYLGQAEWLEFPAGRGRCGCRWRLCKTDVTLFGPKEFVIL
ncbi:MAG: hypothetical protein C0426_15565 [Rhodobacter sp.]|nr:hypothetical protein [Rhodobacter sp.]